MSEITYSLMNGYQIPDLTLGEQPSIGKYGMLRKSYLKEHKRGRYSALMLTGRLYSHLADVDRAAREQIELDMERYLASHPAPDKAIHQMEWVGYMNALKHRVEDQALHDYVYAE